MNWRELFAAKVVRVSAAELSGKHIIIRGDVALMDGCVFENSSIEVHGEITVRNCRLEDTSIHIPPPVRLVR